jgi:hypothetical protein
MRSAATAPAGGSGVSPSSANQRPAAVSIMKSGPDPRTHERSPPGASRRGAVFPEAACGEPDDVGVYGDLDDGLAGVVVWPAGAAAEHAGQDLIPGGGGDLLQVLPLARDPGAAAEGLVDGVGGGADGGLDVPPRMAVQLGEVAALRLEDLGERADVELSGVGVGGRAGPELVAAADGLVRRQAAGDGPGDAAAGGAAAAGWGAAAGRTRRGRAGRGWLAGRWPGVPQAPGVTPSVSQGWLFAGQGACGKAVIRAQAVAMACAQGKLAGIFSRRRRPPRTSLPAACRTRYLL